MPTETVEQFLARGGQITRCPRAFAESGCTPQSPVLTATEAEQIAQHYDALEENYKTKWRRCWWSNANRTHLFIRVNKERLKQSISEEAQL